jgi:hypothetical protein
LAFCRPRTVTERLPGEADARKGHAAKLAAALRNTSQVRLTPCDTRVAQAEVATGEALHGVVVRPG